MAHENREVDTRVTGAGWTRILASRWAVGGAASVSAIQGYLDSRLLVKLRLLHRDVNRYRATTA
jgi:hypothetical protein